LGEIDFKERFVLEESFGAAVDCSRRSIELSIREDAEGCAYEASNAYVHLRYIKQNVGRYNFALSFIDDFSTVLDAPCGSGYGTAILASSGADVIGIDIDQGAIEEAADQFKFWNVDFFVVDMLEKLELGYAFDAIVCFEGLEHVEDGSSLIENFVGVLKEGGRLIISAPINELLITKGEQNPYHKVNYDVQSFSELLKRYFSNVLLFGTDSSGEVSAVDYALDCVLAVCWGIK